MAYSRRNYLSAYFLQEKKLYRKSELIIQTKFSLNLGFLSAHQQLTVETPDGELHHLFLKSASHSQVRRSHTHREGRPREKLE
jgi:hypothetical protein